MKCCVNILPWWISAALVGALLALLTRRVFHSPYDTVKKPNFSSGVDSAFSGTAAMENSRYSLEFGDMFVANLEQRASGSDQTADKMNNGPDTIPRKQASRRNFSSWHRTSFTTECGTLISVLKHQRLQYASRQPIVWRCGCKTSGLGDRLKGIIAAWMLALVLERPFLCEVFPSMAALQYGVEPALIDWRSGYEAYMRNRTRLHPYRTSRSETALRSAHARDYSKPLEIVQITPAKISVIKAFVEFVLGGNGSIFLTEPFVGDGKEFSNDDAPLLSHTFRDAYAHATYCATRSLFKPTLPLLQLLDDTLLSVHEDFMVVGLHVRFGGKWNDRKRARNSDALKMIECAWNMTLSQQHEPFISKAAQDRGTIWLLASDNVEQLQQLIHTFHLADNVKTLWETYNVQVVINQGGKVEHVSKSQNGTEADAIRRLWHDWFLLTEAHTCAFVRSSFPRTACYASERRDRTSGLVQQMVTSLDLGRYPRITPVCSDWHLG